MEKKLLLQASEIYLLSIVAMLTFEKDTERKDLRVKVHYRHVIRIPVY